MPRSLPRLALVLLASLPALAGCAASGLGGAPRVPPSAPDAFGRAPDGLLERADLRALVDAQVLRQVAPLVEALASADAAVRARAAFALASVQSAEAIPALLPLLGDPDARVRADAAFALGQSADSSAALPLVNALARERDPAAQRELLDALGKTGDRASLAAILRLDLPAGLEPARALALGRYGLRNVHSDAAAAQLVAWLAAPDAALREAAAYYFGRVRDPQPWRARAADVRLALDRLAPGDPAAMHLVVGVARLADAMDVPRLAGRLDDPDWRVRASAARALGTLPMTLEGVGAALAAALDDPSPHVGRTAADALAAAPALPPALVPPLAAWLAEHGERWLVAGSLLPALARAGHEDAVTGWLDRVPDRQPDEAAPFARALGVTALGAAAGPLSLDRLFVAARTEDPRVAYAGVEALKARWAAVRGTAPEAQRRRFYDTFAAALRRRDLATTTAAAPALADSLFLAYNPGGLLRSTYAQMEAPRDIEPMVEIVRAAGLVRDGQEVDFLVGVTLGGHPVLREAAAEALDGRLVEGIDVDAANLLPPPTILVEWDYLQELGPRPLLVLETRLGQVVIEMDAEGAPQTVMKLAKTATLRHFDGVPFHRVVPNFVVQGGDFYRRDGYGGPDVNLRSEFTRNRYTTGAAGMASAGKDTEGVQYFVTHSPTPHLDGRYTAFGRVVRGQDVVDRLQPGDVVRRARVVRTSER